MNANPKKEDLLSSTTTASGAITTTWAATSKVPAERVRIGKAWTPEGKWPVTDGVLRLKYFLDRVDYPSLEALAADIERRIAEGTWTMVTGVPRPGLDLTKLHARNGKNFTDAPTSVFVCDFDGMTPDEGQDLSRGEAFEDGAIVDTLRKRLKASGLHSLSKAKIVLVATASTGFNLNSLGEPAHKCGRFRVIFELDRPLSLKRQKVLTEKMGELPGFKSLDAAGEVTEKSCIDPQVKTHAYNIFVARALLPEGMTDPIREPVLIFDGEDEQVDVSALAKELGFDRLAEETAPQGAQEPVDGSPTAPGPTSLNQAEDAAPSTRQRLLEAPPERRVAIVRKVVAAIPNTLDRRDWVHIAHAIDGALGGDLEGKDIFLGFSGRLAGGSDPAEDERVWDTRGDNGMAGFGYLARLLEAQEALTPNDPVVIEAATALRQGRAAACFTALTDEEIAAARGDTIDALSRRIATPKFRSIADFIAEYKPTREIVHELLSAGCLYTLTAKTGVGKTAWLTSTTLAIATGRSDILARKVAKGRVAFCTAENPDGLRMRLAVTARHWGVDPVAIGNAVLVSDIRARPEDIYAQLEANAREHGSFEAVFIDTWQAFFDGKDSSSPAEALAFTIRFRPLTQLPGGPVVVIAAHPVKRASDDDLIPYGGGSVLNEVDGNVVLSRQASGLIEFGWQGKLRGVDFDPPLFRLILESSPEIVDIEGVEVKLPVLLPATQAEAEAKENAIISRDTSILRAIDQHPGASSRGLGMATNMPRATMERALAKMAKAKPPLIRKELGKWALTKAGKEALA